MITFIIKPHVLIALCQLIIYSLPPHEASWVRARWHSGWWCVSGQYRTWRCTCSSHLVATYIQTNKINITSSGILKYIGLSRYISRKQHSNFYTCVVTWRFIYSCRIKFYRGVNFFLTIIIYCIIQWKFILL